MTEIQDLQQQLQSAHLFIERMAEFLFNCEPKPKDQGVRGGPKWAELVTDSFSFTGKLSGDTPKPRPRMGQNNNNNANTAMSDTTAEPTAEPQTPATPTEGEAQPPTTPYPGDEPETQEIPPTEAPAEAPAAE